jgi:hypothetical protein
LWTAPIAGYLPPAFHTSEGYKKFKTWASKDPHMASGEGQLHERKTLDHVALGYGLALRDALTSANLNRDSMPPDGVETSADGIPRYMFDSPLGMPHVEQIQEYCNAVCQKILSIHGPPQGRRRNRSTTLYVNRSLMKSSSY